MSRVSVVAGSETIPFESLQWRLEKFWGYGSLDAPVWFVGMEEGLSNGGEEYLEARFRATQGKVTVDIRADMSAVQDHMIWFKRRARGNPYRIQTTIKYPIALYLRLKDGIEPNHLDISVFQGEKFGGPDTCAIELMPLPSNKTDETTWLYRNYASLGLISRSSYMTKYKSSRVKALSELLNDREPDVVIFYSVSYLKDWEAVAGTKLREITPQMYFSRHGRTSYCVIPQGAAYGMSYKRLYEYADLIEPEIIFGNRKQRSDSR